MCKWVNVPRKCVTHIVCVCVCVCVEARLGRLVCHFLQENDSN